MNALTDCKLADGGFSRHPAGSYHSDATAWAVVALRIAGVEEGLLRDAMARLADDQLSDGRVSISFQHPNAFWPTAIAILAWQGSKEFGSARAKAVRFLIETTGLHWERTVDQVVAHDTSIKGWPWIEDTHSWVEPTAMAALALEIAGRGGEKRTKEAVRMLLDRQLPSGGWNYGNTSVFGKELHPMPESTGVALSALAGQVSRNRVEKSLEYLRRKIDQMGTPLALGWSLLGLAAWDERIDRAESLIDGCLRKQDGYGAYGTSLLSLLLVAAVARRGIAEALTQ
jgi:hypothetical protein